MHVYLNLSSMNVFCGSYYLEGKVVKYECLSKLLYLYDIYGSWYLLSCSHSCCLTKLLSLILPNSIDRSLAISLLLLLYM